MGISMSGSKPRPLGVACRRATQLRSKYATSQADASVAKSRRLSRRVLTRSGSGQRLSSPCCALVRDANRSSHKASSTSKCSVAAATKLLHAVSAQRKLLTSQHESRSSLQSIIGATLTLLFKFNAFARITKVIFSALRRVLLRIITRDLAPVRRLVPPGCRSKVTLIFGRRIRAANDALEEQAVGHL
jgi:hypothetical protein